MDTTALPPPTAEHLDRFGVWPREHMRALARELDDLTADLDRVHLPPGASQLPAGEIATLVAGRIRVMVGVYAPGGMTMHSLGWIPREQVPEANDRVLTYLPGAREQSERPRGPGYRPNALMIQWGSRRPNWSPTAVFVDRGFMPEANLWREAHTLWTVAQVAEHLGVQASTVRSYLARRDAGIPSPLGDAPVGPHGRRVEVWDAQKVIDWHAARPGKGGRPPKASRGT